MIYLVIVTLVWAFSFSLIGEFLAGHVDSYFAVLIRVFLASIIFVPFTDFKNIKNSLKLKIMGIGVVQIGLMYIFFYKSFLFLSVPEVLLFTIFTPLYITLYYDFLQKRFTPLYILSVSLAVLGAFVIRYQEINSDFLFGFLLVQGANICFAIGQTSYKYIMEDKELKNIPQYKIFGYFHFGALTISVITFAMFGNFEKMSPSLFEWEILFWLGIVASGLGYYLWNKGACQVDAGVLAIMNNVLVPAGLVVNIAIWGKEVNYLNLSIGGSLIMLSLILHYMIMKKIDKQK